MFAWYLGWRWLTRRRAAWLAFAAVTLTVTVSVAVMGVVQGFIEVVDRQVRANEADLTLLPDVSADGLEDTPSERTRLAGIAGVAGIAPTLQGFCLATPRHVRGGASGFRESFPTAFDAVAWDHDWALGRLPENCLHRRPALDLSAPRLTPEERGTGFLTPRWRARLALLGGEVFAFGPLPLTPRPWPTPGIVVGQEIAYLQGLDPGDGERPGTILHLSLPNGRGGLVGKIEVEVADTLGTGIYEVDKFTCLLPLPIGQRLTNLHAKAGQPGLVTGWRVQLTPGQDLLLAKRSISQAAGLFASTWLERRGHLVKGAIQQRNVIGFVMILVQVLAVFIVYAVFSTLVAEKRHDIGVLIGLGAPRHAVAGAFLAASLLCCVVGGLLGWALGWLILLGLNPFSQLTGIILFPQEFFYSPDTPISFAPLIPLTYIGIMTAIGLLAALLPARSAATIDPIVTLREGA